MDISNNRTTEKRSAQTGVVPVPRLECWRSRCEILSRGTDRPLAREPDPTMPDDQDRLVDLPELPLDLDPPLSFFDEKVGNFVALISRGISSSFMIWKQLVTRSSAILILRLYRWHDAQQDAFEEKHFSTTSRR